MPTPHGAEYAEFEGNTDTLLIGSLALWATDYSGLKVIGDSIGDNIQPAGANGEVGRPSTRAGVDGQISTLVLDGRFSQDNEFDSGCPANQWRLNALTLSRYVDTFFDTHCTGRQFTLRVVDLTGTYEASAKFLSMDKWTEHTPRVFTTSLLLRIAPGILTEAA